MSNLTEVPQLAAMSVIADTTKIADENEHLEMLDSKNAAEIARPADVPVSAFAHCSKREILRKFWRLVLTAIAVSLGAMYVGYGLSVTGSIIANPGTHSEPRELPLADRLFQASSLNSAQSTRLKGSS